MNQFALPFLVFCIVALLTWVLVAERRQDKKEAQKLKAEIASQRTALKPKRQASSRS